MTDSSSMEQSAREAFDAWCKLREQRDLAEARAQQDHERKIPNDFHLMAFAHGIDMARAGLDIPQSADQMRDGFGAMIDGAALALREVNRLRAALRALGAHQFVLADERSANAYCLDCNEPEEDPVHVPGL